MKSFLLAISCLQQLPPTLECCSSASSPWAVWVHWPFGKFSIWDDFSRQGSWLSKYAFPAQPRGIQLDHQDCAFVNIYMMHRVTVMIFYYSSSLLKNLNIIHVWHVFLLIYSCFIIKQNVLATGFWEEFDNFSYLIRSNMQLWSCRFKIEWTPTYLFPYSSQALYILLSFWRLGFCNSCRDKNALSLPDCCAVKCFEYYV